MNNQYTVKILEAGKVTRSSVFEAANEKEAARAAATAWLIPTHSLGTQFYFEVQKMHIAIYSVAE